MHTHTDIHSACCKSVGPRTPTGRGTAGWGSWGPNRLIWGAGEQVGACDFIHACISNAQCDFDTYMYRSCAANQYHQSASKMLIIVVCFARSIFRPHDIRCACYCCFDCFASTVTPRCHDARCNDQKNRERFVLTVNSPSVTAMTTDITTCRLRLAQCDCCYSGHTISAVKTRLQLTNADRKVTTLYINPEHCCLDPVLE